MAAETSDPDILNVRLCTRSRSRSLNLFAPLASLPTRANSWQLSLRFVPQELSIFSCSSSGRISSVANARARMQNMTNRRADERTERRTDRQTGRQTGRETGAERKKHNCRSGRSAAATIVQAHSKPERAWTGLSNCPRAPVILTLLKPKLTT